MLTGTQVDDDAVLAGSLHTRVRACWIHARTGPMHACTGPMHACTGPMHACTRPTHACTRPTHACTRPTHACSHQVPTPARSQGPSRTLAPGPHACSLVGSPRTHAHGVPMHACTGPMHARSHRAPMPTHLRGPHVRWIPALMYAASHVVCISSYM
jgi:hypothetical protein